jgi:DUF2947 family protein
MKGKLPILESEYSEYFSDATVNSVFLLSINESQNIWNNNIDQKADSYFRLPDDNWLVVTEQIIIGDWKEDFNANKVQDVQQLLNRSVTWNDEDIVLFCIRKNKILETNWSEFKRLWINFILCEDDCPILINHQIKGCAILFRPIGDIAKIGQCKNH